MPGWKTWEKLLQAGEDPFVAKMEKAMNDHFCLRQEKMQAIRKELEQHFGLPVDTKLSKQLAWILTSDRWT